MTALFLVYLFYGGDINLSWRILAVSSSDGTRTKASYRVYLLNDTEWMATYRFHMRGSALTSLFLPQLRNPDRRVSVEQMFEALTAGRTREILRALYQERLRLSHLDVESASARLREKFGSPLRMWEECQSFGDRDPFEDAKRAWAVKRGERSTETPILWKPVEYDYVRNLEAAARRQGQGRGRHGPVRTILTGGSNRELDGGL